MSILTLFFGKKRQAIAPDLKLAKQIEISGEDTPKHAQCKREGAAVNSYLIPTTQTTWQDRKKAAERLSDQSALGQIAIGEELFGDVVYYAYKT